MECQVTTAAGAKTIYITQAEWKGRMVAVQNVDELPCAVHQLEVMHHTDAEGRHYCPTGFLWCPRCGGTADEPEPYSCTICGATPDA